MENSNRADIRPDYRHYTPVSKGFVDARDVDSATRLLIRRVEGYMMNGKNDGANPIPADFHMVTIAWTIDPVIS